MFHEVRKTRRYAALALASLIAFGGITGCSALTGEKSDDSKPAPSASSAAALTVDQDLRAKLPDSVKTGGSVTFAVSAASQPAAFVENKNTGEIVGVMPDLLTDVGQILGIKIKLENSDFSAIMPGVTAKRFDAGVLIGDFKERQQQFDMIDLFQNGFNILVSKANPKAIKTSADFCGNSIAVLSASFQETSIKKMSTDLCVAKGKQPIDIQGFPDQNSELLALSSARVAGILFDNAPAQYLAKQRPTEYTALGTFDLSAPNSILFDKSSTGLRDAVLGALTKLYDAGTYQAAYQKWGLEGVLVKPVINGSTFSLAG